VGRYNRKYLEPIRKWDGGYDLKIFIVINAHTKHPYVFFIHNSMNITIKPQTLKKKKKKKKKNKKIKIHKKKNYNNITNS